MTITEWSASVNTDFYAGTNGFKDNSITSDFLSGRTTVYKANDKYQKTKELSLRLSNTGTSSEYEAFNNWFTEVLGGLTGIFHCSALDEGTTSLYWRFSEMPSEDNGQRWKEITINIEQVYA